MRPLVVPLVALFLLPVAVPGHAEHCNGNIITIGTGPLVLYIDDRSSGPGEIHHWVYIESNGLDGLQSGGDADILDDQPFSFTDPCAHVWPDQLII